MARSVLITNPADSDDIASPVAVSGFVSPHDQTVTVSLYRPGAAAATFTSTPITPNADGSWSTSITVSADGEYLLIAQQTGLPITHSVSITVSLSVNEKKKPPQAAKKKSKPTKTPAKAKAKVKAKGKKR